MKKSILIFGILLTSQWISAQCEVWEGTPRKDELENYHVIYRQAIKAEDMQTALENWEKVFPAAPNADGRRDIQYFDGVELLKYKMNNTSDEAEKKAIVTRILGLYDQMAACYQNGSLTAKCDDNVNCLNKYLGYIYGRKAYEMFYFLNSPYVPTMQAIKEAIKFAGINNEYVIFDPAARITVYQFQNKVMTKEEVVEIYKQLNEIADHNILNHPTLSEYYQQAKENMNATFRAVEEDVFDYEFFKEKFLPEYEEASDNPDVLKKIILVLKQKNCPADDPFLMLVESKWEKYAKEYNSKVQAEFEATNPAVAAKRLYDEGKYNEAIDKYYDAMEKETDNEKKASYLFSIASIQFRKLSAYSTARATAKDALKYRPNWGRPYMLIGDMYGKTARNCGDDWNQRLAIIAAIDMYSKARSLDSEVAGEANDRISSYSKSLPDGEIGFMMKKKEGDIETVGCWIGETVRVRFK